MPPWKRLQIPTKNNLSQAFFMMNGATYSFQCTTSNIQLCNQLVLYIKTYCINTGFIFMNIKPLSLDYCKITSDWTNRSDASLFPSSFLRFCFAHVFSFLIFPISFGILEIFPRSPGMCEAEGKAIPKAQFWIKLKATLVTQVPWINTSFYKTESDAW